jgi:hypothetical protein
LVEFSTILQFIQATGIIVGVAYYILNIQNNQRNQKHTLETRQAQLFAQYLNNMDRAYWDKFEEIRTRWSWTDYSDFMSKYGPEANPDEWLNMDYTLYPFEQLGILMKQGIFDPQMMYDQVGGFIISLWEKLEPVLNEYRKRNDAGAFYEYTEDFYYVMKEMRSKDRAAYRDRYIDRMKRRKALGLEMTALYSD